MIRGAQRQENGATEGETLVHGLLPLTCKTCDGNDGADMREAPERTVPSLIKYLASTVCPSPGS